MRRHLLRNGLIFALAVCLSTVLLSVSQNVQKSENIRNNLEVLIIAEQEALRVLEAEWTYLNSPLRLEGIVQEYFEMSVPDTDQYIESASSLSDSSLIGQNGKYIIYIDQAPIPIRKPAHNKWGQR